MTARSPARVEEARRTAWTVMAAVLATHAALVATHEGEFWPFSIYPMFSQAGKPWVRTVLYELDAVAGTPSAGLRWGPQRREELPGRPLAAAALGIEVVDLAKYVSMTERWDEVRIAGLRKMLGDAADRQLIVFSVSGRLEREPTPRVALAYEPVLVLGGAAGTTGGAAGMTGGAQAP